MDVIEPISPPSSKGHCFILAITDYFSKLVEVVSLKEVKISVMIKFIKLHILYRFGVPDELSMIMDANSSAKHSRGSVINSEFKVCL